ncbi:arylsulfatase [Peribacillus loiseleuriae]|uniref:arylsulfatase n=1 Tax=Peribacillus loiseleuriae TaxID=1679170 RepID=UPI003CFD34E1
MMSNKSKGLQMDPLKRLTVAASAFALLSGCSDKNFTVKEVNSEAVKQKSTESKENAIHKNNTESPKPNVVYIILDDSGYSDLGSYGSEIQTPNLDWLAENGLRYNNSHVTPLCSPTRAALLTGRNSHAVGMGTVANYDFGSEYPNKRGRIDPEAGTIAEVLKENDYNTYALGKWHLAPTHQTTAAGSYENWPLGKGFDRYYGILEDSTDQYKPDLVLDNSFIEASEKEDYHFSEDIVNQAKQYVTDQASIHPDKPFFLYLSFGAQHQPIQVPEQYIEMYKGVYDKGWDQIREERFERQKELGIIPKDAKLTERNRSVKPWDELTDVEKKTFVRFQEAYAGFLTHTDEQVGRFLDHLRSLGELDDTMIVFLSDNGASGLGKDTGSINHTLAYNDLPETIEEIAGKVDEIGNDKVKADFPAGWAQVSNTPFKQYKTSMYEGGTKTPLIVYYPKAIKDKGAIRNQYQYVTDITPTVYDVAGIKMPKEIKGVKQMPLHGKSFAKTFTDAKVSGKETQYYESNGHRGIYHDGWKAIATHTPGKHYEKDQWELYHVAQDRTETQNVASQHEEKLEELKKVWEKEAKKYDVLPLTDIGKQGFMRIPENTIRSRNSFTFYPGMSVLPEGASPFILDRSYEITVPITRGNVKDEGVLVALGSYESGYTLYIKDNQLVYEYNIGVDVYRIESEIEVPVGSSDVKFVFERTGSNEGNGVLFIDDEKVGEGTIGQTHKYKVSFEGLSIGEDSHYPVSPVYQDKGTFPFSGELEKVIFDLEPMK